MSENKRIIKYKGDEFELKYNMKTIELIESQTGLSTLGELASKNAMLPINILKVYFVRALYKIGGGRVAHQQAEDIFYALLEEPEGYMTLIGLVVEKVQEDCPFLFPAS